jgi:hypothetical protein
MACQSVISRDHSAALPQRNYSFQLDGAAGMMPWLPQAAAEPATWRAEAFMVSIRYHSGDLCESGSHMCNSQPLAVRSQRGALRIAERSKAGADANMSAHVVVGMTGHSSRA